MTRKDYVAVAAAIHEVMTTIRADIAAGNGPDIEADAVALNIGYGLAAVFAADNPRFDRERFFTACDFDEAIPSEAYYN
jgi:hypothetical protein